MINSLVKVKENQNVGHQENANFQDHLSKENVQENVITFQLVNMEQEKKCCHSCKTCQSYKYTETPKKRPKVCETKENKCFWKGKVVVKRVHRKCAVKIYGLNKERKRCCNWIVRCVGKHCRVAEKKCSWEGCIFTSKKKDFCRYKMKNDHEKQKFFVVHSQKNVVEQNVINITINANLLEKFIEQDIIGNVEW